MVNIIIILFKAAGALVLMLFGWGFINSPSASSNGRINIDTASSAQTEKPDNDKC
ncbi:MAG: hypothetical protein PHW04_07665 [Candidatus Wallbacteria bacterium]|nr:hypothetical protein [Candidatus Wallbacteria bacterium]